jgi:hypothetical protein
VLLLKSSPSLLPLSGDLFFLLPSIFPTFLHLQDKDSKKLPRQKTRDKKNSYLREYRKKNRERISEYQREYRKKNRGKKMAYLREYRGKKNSRVLGDGEAGVEAEKKKAESNKSAQEYHKKNREKILPSLRKYYHKNREKLLQDKKEYYKKNREKKLRTLHEEKKLLGLPPPRKYFSWKSVDEVRKFFENFSELHHVKKWPDDWYRISIKQVQLAGGQSLPPPSLFPSWPFFLFPPSPSPLPTLHLPPSLSPPLSSLLSLPLPSLPPPHHIPGSSIIGKYRNLGKALKMAFPKIEWELDKFSLQGKKSIQGWYEEEGDGGGLGKERVGWTGRRRGWRGEIGHKEWEEGQRIGRDRGGRGLSKVGLTKKGYARF